jgi:hypothetical protein
MKLAIGLLVLFASGISSAAQKSAHKTSGNNSEVASYYKKVAAWPTQPANWMSPVTDADEARLTQALAETTTPARTTASAGKDAAWYEAKMSPEFKAVRAQFLELKTPEQLDEFLVKLNASFDKMPSDLKFFAAQVIPLRTMRGIVWKMIPAVENQKLLHSLLLTQVKTWAVNLKIYFPTPQWEAGLRYVSEPYMVDGALAKQFSSEADLQGYSGSVVFPSLLAATKRIEQLNFTTSEGVWDNQFIFGKASFAESIDRYRLIGEVERFTVLTNMESALASIAFNRAYSMDQAFAMNADLGKLYGWDSAIGQVDGVPSENVVNTIRKYGSWGQLMSDGKTWTDLAFSHMKKSVYDARWLASHMSQRPSSEEYLADNSSFATYMRPINYRLKNMTAMMKGPTELRSAITGETTSVDVPAFFKQPPADLKAFYGTEFDKSPTMKAFPSEGAKVTEYRNYLHGRPVGWKLDAYRPYLPKVQSNADLIKAARVMSQSWAGFAPLGALYSYVQ